MSQVVATTNKEKCSDYIVHAPHWLWRFMPNCFITPQHILEKHGKKDSQIFNAS
jgi:hypothetical protein